MDSRNSTSLTFNHTDLSINMSHDSVSSITASPEAGSFYISRNLIFFNDSSPVHTATLLFGEEEASGTKGKQEIAYTLTKKVSRDKKIPRVDFKTFFNGETKSVFIPLPSSAQLRGIVTEKVSYLQYSAGDKVTVTPEMEEFDAFMDVWKPIFEEAVKFIQATYQAFDVKIWENRDRSISFYLYSNKPEKGGYDYEKIATELNENRNCFKMVVLKYFTVKKNDLTGKIVLFPVFEILGEPFIFPVSSKKRRVEDTPASKKLRVEDALEEGKEE